VVSAGGVLAHGNGSDVGHDHERAVADSLRIQDVGINEIVDEEGDLADPFSPPERATDRPEFPEEKSSPAQQPERSSQGDAEDLPRRPLHVAPVERDVPKLLEEPLVEKGV